MSESVFWIVMPCVLVGRYRINVTGPILKDEDGCSMLVRKVGNYIHGRLKVLLVFFVMLITNIVNPVYFVNRRNGYPQTYIVGTIACFSWAIRYTFRSYIGPMCNYCTIILSKTLIKLLSPQDLAVFYCFSSALAFNESRHVKRTGIISSGMLNVTQKWLLMLSVVPWSFWMALQCVYWGLRSETLTKLKMESTKYAACF